MKATNADYQGYTISPRVVEILGPAGAGKSTLTHALVQANERIVQEFSPDYRKIDNLPFFTYNTLLMLPTFFQILVSNSGEEGNRSLTLQEMAWMVTLIGWDKRLKRQVASSNKIVILDQGPIFMLSSLKKFGPSALKNKKTKNWWVRTLRYWSHALDLVIWLDAPNQVLLDRIRNRPVWHGNKARTEQAAFAFMEDFRDIFRQLISDLSRNSNPLKMNYYNTAEMSLNEIVEAILHDFGLFWENPLLNENQSYPIYES